MSTIDILLLALGIMIIFLMLMLWSAYRVACKRNMLNYSMEEYRYAILFMGVVMTAGWLLIYSVKFF